MRGMRDQQYRREIDVAAIAGQVRLLTVDAVQAGPARAVTQAAGQVASEAPGWWLHTDLDVLAGNEFSAFGAANDPSMPGSLSWAELTAVVSSALRAAAAAAGASVSTTRPGSRPPLCQTGRDLPGRSHW
jgi:arginase family enzyme